MAYLIESAIAAREQRVDLTVSNELRLAKTMAGEIPFNADSQSPEAIKRNRLLMRVAAFEWRKGGNFHRRKKYLELAKWHRDVSK